MKKTVDWHPNLQMGWTSHLHRGLGGFGLKKSAGVDPRTPFTPKTKPSVFGASDSLKGKMHLDPGRLSRQGRHSMPPIAAPRLFTVFRMPTPPSHTQTPRS